MSATSSDTSNALGPSDAPPSQRKRLGVLVLGMHRSGTSAIAGMFAQIGFDAGSGEDLMEADEANPRGYFERVGMMRANDAALEGLGASWDLPPDQGTVEAAREELAGVFETALSPYREASHERPLVIKDPRITLLLSAWWPLLQNDFVPVLTLRNPLEIARSLARRDGISLHAGLGLWEVYMTRALDVLEATPVHVAGYEGLVTDPAARVRLVKGVIEEIDDALRVAVDVTLAGDAVDFALRRNRADEAELEQYATPRQLALWRYLAGLPEGRSVLLTPVELRQDTPAALEAARHESGLRHELDDVRAELAESRLEVADKVAQVQRAMGLLDERERERDTARLAHADLARENAERARENAELARENADRSAELEGLGRRVAELESQSRVLESHLGEAELSVEGERRRADRLSAVLKDVRAMLTESRGEAAEARVALAESERMLQEHEAPFEQRARRRYRARVERHAPQGTGRRAAYMLAIRGVRRIVGRSLPAGSAGHVPHEEPLVLPTSDTPLVSVVIPVHGKWDVTQRCLASIAAHDLDASVEVIVVDDASPDDTLVHLERVVGCRVVPLAVNQGYIGACNAGIASAKGDFVLLLNNDTEVTPGWLEALLSVAEGDPTVGVVGAKLVFPDGRLQEAGGIVWNDASGWNYGRGENPASYEFNFVRDVDYCSGACLLVRRDLLEQLGGLDERYAPAYYDDTDVAFAARDLGYRVVYQPACTIVHHEGVSHGTELTSGIKRFQEVNRVVFAEKWRDALAKQWPSNPDTVALASWRGEGRGHVLVVDYQVPRFDRDSGSLRMTRLVEEIADMGFQVTFLSDNRLPLQPYTALLQQKGINVAFGDVHERNLISSLAPRLRYAVLSRPSVAWRYLPIIRELSPDTKIFFDTVDLHHIREQRRAELDGDESRLRVAGAWRELELGLVRSCDATLVVSPTEVTVLEEECPGAKVEVVSNIHKVRAGAVPSGDREGLLFVGGFNHPPNVDAMLWFCRDVLPLVQREIPGVSLTIAGDSPPAEILALQGPSVKVTGYVEDLDPLHLASRVFVAPLRYGAGVKGKIAESLALGLPLVSTSVGGEGMGLLHEVDVLVADDEHRFASAVVRLYRDDALWSRLARAGKQRVEEDFSTAALRRKLEQLMA